MCGYVLSMRSRLQTWDEQAELLRKELYRLNMELPYWEAQGDRELVCEIKVLIAATRKALDEEGRRLP